MFMDYATNFFPGIYVHNLYEELKVNEHALS